MRLTVPMTDNEEIEEIVGVLRSGYLTQGPKATEFEDLIAAYCQTQGALATSSCTTALQLVLAALDIRPGDEVVVPDFTFPATGNVVVQQGATPVIVDIDPVTYTMDPVAFEAAVTERTRAVIPVHAFGLCADMDAINAIATRRGIDVIEDAACALGGLYKGRKAGSLGKAGCFSFHPRKVITTGEGGMITADDVALLDRMRLLGSHGGLRRDSFMEFVSAGFNYRMSDLNAAVGVAQMRKLHHILERRHVLADLYSEAIASIDGVRSPLEPPEVRHTFQSYVVQLDSIVDRAAVRTTMGGMGIETTLGTYSMHAQPFYQENYGLRLGECPNGLAAFSHSLTLPLYPQMDESDVGMVVGALKAALA